MTQRAFTALFDALRDCDRVLLTGPTDPDGDSLGACLALQRVLARWGVQADVAGAMAYRYAWMPGAADVLPDEHVTADYDAVVVLDGDRHRLPPEVRTAFDAARLTGLVDHHASTSGQGYTHPVVAPSATSTCEMLYDALLACDEPIDHDLAVLLYVGAIFDTGGFRYSNTTPATLRMAAHLLDLGIEHSEISARILMERREAALRAAGHLFSTAELHLEGQLCIGVVSMAWQDSLGLLQGDLEGLVDALLFTEGVEVAVLLIERNDDVKVSLRSRGRVNVARIASDLVPSGGGHVKAAGATLALDLDDTRVRIVEAVAEGLCTRVA